MPNDERNLETLPDGALGLIPLESCKELGLKVDKYLVGWREKRQHQHASDLAFKDYRRDSYIISTAVPRFGTGEAKGVIKESVRGYDLYLMVDVTNYSLTYSVCGHENHMSPVITTAIARISFQCSWHHSPTFLQPSLNFSQPLFSHSGFRYSYLS